MCQCFNRFPDLCWRLSHQHHFYHVGYDQVFPLLFLLKYHLICPLQSSSLLLLLALEQLSFLLIGLYLFYVSLKLEQTQLLVVNVAVILVV